MQISRGRLLKQHRSLRRKKPKTWCIVYILREAPGMPARYVGQTRLDPAERLRWHLKDVRKRQEGSLRLSPVKAWIADLSAPPIVEVLDANGIWDVSEAVWIDRLRTRGEPLLNVQSVVA
jgi:hypothetical protein